MTREEAINILEEVKELDDSIYQYNTKYLEALDVAIKTLESNETIPFDMELFQAGLMDMPEGMTNGQVIKALFPNIDVYDCKATLKIYTGIPFENLTGANIDCMKEWWNAPYKAESEDKEECK